MQKFCIWASLISGLYAVGALVMYRLGWIGPGPAETVLDYILFLPVLLAIAMVPINIVTLVVFLIRKDWRASRTVLLALGVLVVLYLVAVMIGLPTA